MTKNQIVNSAGIVSGIGLLALPAFLTLAPMTSVPDTYADEATANVSSDGGVSVSVGTALAITATNVSVSATPTVGNTFVTATSTVNVKNTGSEGGYHLIMSSKNGGSLKNGSNSINSIASDMTGAQMRDAGTSSWGYTTSVVSGTDTASGDLLNTYKAIPTSSTSWNISDYLKNTTDYTNTTAGDDITVGYGFAIGPDVAAGGYTDIITYTAVPNKSSKTIFDMTNMQDLAKYPSACYNTPTPSKTATEDMTGMTGYTVGQMDVDKVPMKRLVDTREGGVNSYEIRKLADGNCWMSENLRLGSQGAALTLTSADTDLNRTASYALPAAQTSGNTAWGQNPYTNKNVYYNSSTVTPTVGDNKVAQTVGGYYSWYTAVAYSGVGYNGSLGDVTTADVVFEDSICPKGWQLPENAADSKKSFYNLTSTTYGLADNKADDSTKMQSKPLRFVLSGYYHYSGGVYYQGSFGYWWSSTSYSSPSSRYLYLHASRLLPQSNYSRGLGLAVRCIAR